MKSILKFIVFIEVLTLVLIGGMHLIMYLFGEDLSGFLSLYWQMPSIVLLLVLFTIFIVTPLADKWLD